VSVGPERVSEVRPFAVTLTETPSARADKGKLTKRIQTMVYMVSILTTNLWEMAFDIKIFSHYIS
jgi:hypothetical protein